MDSAPFSGSIRPCNIPPPPGCAPLMETKVSRGDEGGRATLAELRADGSCGVGDGVAPGGPIAHSLRALSGCMAAAAPVQQHLEVQEAAAPPPSPQLYSTPMDVTPASGSDGLCPPRATSSHNYSHTVFSGVSPASVSPSASALYPRPSDLHMWFDHSLSVPSARPSGSPCVHPNCAPGSCIISSSPFGNHVTSERSVPGSCLPNVLTSCPYGSPSVQQNHIPSHPPNCPPSFAPLPLWELAYRGGDGEGGESHWRGGLL